MNQTLNKFTRSPYSPGAGAPIGIGLAIATLLLSGCAPEPGEVDAPVPAPTVTVTATPTPGAARPDYGFTFFEEATIGSTWDEMSAQLHYPVAGITTGEAECPWYGAVWNSEITSTYAFMDSTDMAAGTRFFYTNRLLASDSAPFPRNAEGVGVGSTQEQILAAYPSAAVGVSHDMGAGDITTMTVEDPNSDSKYVFGISSGNSVVDLLQWGPDAGHQWSHLCLGF